MKRVRSAVVGLVVLAPLSVSAQVLISEIMYDLAEGSDSGREWIEVYNAGTLPVTFTDRKLYENGTDHKITAVSGGEVLASGSYAIIADNAEKFKVEHQAFVGQLFDSTFNLSNTGEAIVLRDSTGADIDPVTYTSALGANGTGDSLQRTELVTGESFSAGIPTPGAGSPAGGLVKTPRKEKKPVPASAKKSSLKNVSFEEVAESTIVGTPAEEPFSGETQVAGAALATPAYTPDYLWWLGMLAIASAGAIGVSWSRRIKRTEWQIEEIS